VNEEALAPWGGCAPKKQTNKRRNYDCAQSHEGGNQAVCRVKKVWESQVQENFSIMSLAFFSHVLCFTLGQISQPELSLYATRSTNIIAVSKTPRNTLPQDGNRKLHCSTPQQESGSFRGNALHETNMSLM
jgi:hypothetical protein